MTEHKGMVLPLMQDSRSDETSTKNSFKCFN